MMKLLCAVACVALCGHARAVAQSQCAGDAHCAVDFFCADKIRLCTPCVDCAVYGRQPAPPLPDRHCAKQQDDCGPCVQREEALVDGWCGGRGAGLPAWGVALLVLLLVFVAAALVLLLYLRRHTNTQPGVSSETVVNGHMRVPAESPSPPPYNHFPAYNDADPPYTDQPAYNDVGPPYTDEPTYDTHQPAFNPPLAPPPSPPYKRSSPQRAVGGVAEAERQDARAFHPPHWVRAPHPRPDSPPSYLESVSPASPVADPDDDNTVESVWSPLPVAQNSQVASSLGEQLRAARARYEPESPPPAKRTPAITQDAGGSSGSSPPPRTPPPPPASHPPTSSDNNIIIQIINQVANVENHL